MKIKLDSSQHLSFNLACPVHLKLTDSTGKIPQAARAAQRQVESRHKICLVSLWATMSGIFIAPFLSRNWQDLVHGPASPQSDLACRRNPQASDARPCQRPITIPMFRNLLWFSYVLFVFILSAFTLHFPLVSRLLPYCNCCSLGFVLVSLSFSMGLPHPVSHHLVIPESSHLLPAPSISSQT